MQLTVKRLENRDPGSGTTVVDCEAPRELGVDSGNLVTVHGRDGTAAVARVWPSDATDAGRDAVRIDDQLRRTADEGSASVEEIEVPVARFERALDETGADTDAGDRGFEELPGVT